MTVTLHRPTTTTCPDGFPWCTSHDVDVEGGYYHRTGTTAATAFMTMWSGEPMGLSVHGEQSHEPDGTVSPLLWLDVNFDSLALRPDEALTFGLAIVAAARALLTTGKDPAR